MLIILFGLAGSGKNFVGEIIAKQNGYYFWDADQSLSAEVRQAILEKKTITQAMRNQITEMIIQRASSLLKTHSKLVIAQALYKEANREMIRKQFPDALFIHIEADINIISQRLRERNNWVDEGYAKKMAVYFEQPKLKHLVIINNEDEASILEQIKQFL